LNDSSNSSKSRDTSISREQRAREAIVHGRHAFFGRQIFKPEARIFLGLELHGNERDTPEAPSRVAFRLPFDVRRHPWSLAWSGHQAHCRTGGTAPERQTPCHPGAPRTRSIAARAAPWGRSPDTRLRPARRDLSRGLSPCDETSSSVTTSSERVRSGGAARYGEWYRTAADASLEPPRFEPAVWR
jgi:hypothetical protein